MVNKAYPPELRKYMDKRLTLKLNGGRQVTGILRGFDPFMNIVLDEAVEDNAEGDTKPRLGLCVVRGNTIITMEALERIMPPRV